MPARAHTASTRANVTYDAENNTITVENYDSLPVRLTNVRVKNSQ